MSLILDLEISRRTIFTDSLLVQPARRTYTMMGSSATSDNELDVVKRERVLMDGLINTGWLQDLSFAKKKHLVIK